jgi:hypothetical protein
MYISSAGHLPPVASWLAVFGLATLPLVYVIVRQLASVSVHVRRALAANRRYRHAPLRPGPIIVRGTLDPADDQAVRVKIQQQGTEESTTSRGVTYWRHCWTENARSRSARPFTLHLDSGEKLRVEPGEDWTLIDDLDECVPDPGSTEHSGPLRSRIAALRAGETVVAVGELVAEGAFVGGDAYRDPARREPALRAPRGDDLLLASRSLGRHDRQRAQFHARWLLWALSTTLVLHGLLFVMYDERLAEGKVEQVTITRLEETIEHGRYRAIPHYFVHARSNEGREIDDELSHDFGSLAVGDRVPFVVVGGYDGQLGQSATVNGEAALVGIALVAFFLFRYIRSLRRSVPWYQGGTVIDRGGGRLPKREGIGSTTW